MLCSMPDMRSATRKWSSGWIACTVASLLAGCSTVNEPLNRPEVHWENRVTNHTRSATFAKVQIGSHDAFERTLMPASEPVAVPAARTTGGAESDGVFVGLAISGGGSRSACFAAATLFQLQRLNFLKDVDYISTVSGGSLIGALYCLSTDAEWNPGNIERKITHSFATDLIVQMLLPWNLIGMLSSDLDRSDLLANSFREVLFKRKGKELTFGDLRKDRPRLLINATNLHSGRRFVFCNEAFDDLNSDLSGYPIAYAVAASSAVPVVMHQVTLRDFSTQYPQYAHLIDGGIVDNLGVQSLVEVYKAHVQYAVDHHLPDPYPRGAVFLLIDARVTFDANLSSKSDTSLIDTLKTGAGLSTSSLLTRASNATLSDMILKNSPDEVSVKSLREEIEAFGKSGYLELDDRTEHRVRVIHFALSRLEDIGELPFPSFRESVNNIATYFNIGNDEAFHLFEAADLLMRRKFQARIEPIVEELGARPTIQPPHPTTAPIPDPSLLNKPHSPQSHFMTPNASPGCGSRLRGNTHFWQPFGRISNAGYSRQRDEPIRNGPHDIYHAMAPNAGFGGAGQIIGMAAT